MTGYSFKKIEAKWQKKWEEANIFSNISVSTKPKCYVLEMFPYPSGKIHMGHVRNYSIGDVVARYKMSKGYNVLHPMGWDAFGLPAENAAKEGNTMPSTWTYRNIEEMKTAIKQLGFSIDWSKEVVTCSPEYYQHEQKMFIEFYKHNLAYKKESWVNWDPVEKTVLANEQVIDGKGWRSGALVEQKKLSQWFLKITDFAQDLLENVKLLDSWPNKVKNMQINWIGHSEGALINFPFKNYNLPDTLQKDDFYFENNSLKVYTTRCDTLFGATFMAISLRHPLVSELESKNKELKAFIQKVQSSGVTEESLSKEEKLGFNTGLSVINPINNKEIPIYIANYILDYGTSSVFGCPGHDSRDFEFAKKYNLEIITVVSPNLQDKNFTVSNEASEQEGFCINSDFLNGLSTEEAKKAVIKYIEKNSIGKSKVTYKIKDWGVSRQRYWGCPIPMIYCETCGMQPEKEENLPVKLPEDVNMNSLGNPLDEHPTWKHTKCPKCGNDALRETDTLDTFFESSWYFLRYATVGKEQPLDNDAINYWMAVDKYIGGIEHAVMHLLYARFFLKALKKVGMIETDIVEPFTSLITQGMICHKTYKSESGKWLSPDEIKFDENDNEYVYINKLTNKKEKVIVGRTEKMSKSKKNTVDPTYICDVYGADTSRMFVLSDSPVEKDLEWTDDGVEGIYKFINRFWISVKYHIEKCKTTRKFAVDNLNDEELEIYQKIQTYLDKIEYYIENVHLNKTIALNRELYNYIESTKDKTGAQLSYYVAKVLLIVFNPFIPHVCEELWSFLSENTFLANQDWISCDKSHLVAHTIELPVQILGKTRGNITIAPLADEKAVIQLVKENQVFSKYFTNKEIKKVIYVPNRIINFVVV